MSLDAEIPQIAAWYVALLKPNGFERAVTNLTRQGFETFMPMQKKTVRHARQLRDVFRPVFPGYVFIRFGQKHTDWRKINSTFGVSRLVSFRAQKPAAVPEGLMRALIKRCDEQSVLRPPDDLEAGEAVKMMSGSFAEFVGEIEAFVAADRLRILFDFMGQKTRLDVPRGEVERA
jgi:transcriptional antiterminator RfaH